MGGCPLPSSVNRRVLLFIRSHFWYSVFLFSIIIKIIYSYNLSNNNTPYAYLMVGALRTRTFKSTYEGNTVGATPRNSITLNIVNPLSYT